jgi:Plant mobile domain
MDCRGHKPIIPYHVRCSSILKKLGLYQLALITHTKNVPRLMTTLIERWRPETHTFHLPVGDVTVTMQDVSCMWGLPISGPPVVGRSDGGIERIIRDAFGIDVNSEMMKKKRRTGRGENQEEIIQQSGHRISLKWLHLTYPGLTDGATDEDVARYTQAYLLDLFGSMIFF